MKNITRTFTSTFGKVLVYNPDKKKLESIDYEVDGKFDNDTIVKALGKKGIKALDVISCETCEKLFGMPESDFITLGHAYSERSKENRGMISKSISVNVYTIKVYASDTKTIEDKTITGNSAKEIEKNLPTNFKLLEVVDTHTVESLICMSVKEFKELAKPMIDYFHYMK